ncbi:MAG: hypothetical protein J3Q66DRAFT_394569 [Benniella sp.]|nr:MAG: hypothetical protein J3Q66DRAFT_394569 [Benniella sp.]
MGGDWKKLIDAKRSGADYFLQQTGALVCDPKAYAKARFPQRKEQEIVVSEWASWMRDFRASGSKELRDAANNAPKLCRIDVRDVRKENLGQIQKQCQGDHNDLETNSRKIVAAWLRNQYQYQRIQRAKQAKKARKAEEMLKAKEKEEEMLKAKEKEEKEKLKVKEEKKRKAKEKQKPKAKKKKKLKVEEEKKLEIEEKKLEVEEEEEEEKPKIDEKA